MLDFMRHGICKMSSVTALGSCSNYIWFNCAVVASKLTKMSSRSTFCKYRKGLFGHTCPWVDPYLLDVETRLQALVG
jgi:hypothetical protein